MAFEYLWEKERAKVPGLVESINEAGVFLQAKVNELAKELPGVELGYIGNIERWGDDRGWHVFLPHPDRVGGYEDSIPLGGTVDLPKAVTQWDAFEAAAKRKYHNGTRRI